jgi:hypothetical protein
MAATSINNATKLPPTIPPTAPTDNVFELGEARDEGVVEAELTYFVRQNLSRSEETVAAGAPVTCCVIVVRPP